MKTSILRILSIVLLAAGLACLLFADGESRKSTEKEKQFYQEVLTVIKNAIPPGPSGWSESRPDVDPLETVSVGTENYPFRFEYNVSWDDNERKQKADEKMLDATKPIMTDAGRKAELDKLMKENEKLAKQLGDAISKNDQAGGQKIMKQLEALQKKIEVVTNAQDKEMDAALEKTSARDVSANVRIYVNLFSEWTNPSTVAGPAVAGFKSFQTKGGWTKERGWSESITYVVVTKQNQVSLQDSYITIAEPKGVPSLAVQAIILSVQADPARAKGILQKIDWAALKRLLK